MIKSCLTAFSICLSEESWKYKITSARNLKWNGYQNRLKGICCSWKLLTFLLPSTNCTFLPELFLTSLEGIQVWISQKQLCKCERGLTGFWFQRQVHLDVFYTAVKTVHKMVITYHSTVEQLKCEMCFPPKVMKASKTDQS